MASSSRKKSFLAGPYSKLILLGLGLTLVSMVTVGGLLLFNLATVWVWVARAGVLTGLVVVFGGAYLRWRVTSGDPGQAAALEALRVTLTSISSELDQQKLFQAILERSCELVGATGGNLAIYDSDKQQLTVTVSYNSARADIGTVIPLGQGASGRVAQTGQPLVIQNYLQWEGRSPQFLVSNEDFAMLVTPLKAGGRLVGTLNITDNNPNRRFTEADLRLINLFTPQAGVAIENARLYQSVECALWERWPPKPPLLLKTLNCLRPLNSAWPNSKQFSKPA
jgi:putative methionine-R-sulfoxide reductase with GAF domain